MKLRGWLTYLLRGFTLSCLCSLAFVVPADSQGSGSVRSLHVIATDNSGVNLSYPSTIFYDIEGDEIYITDAAKGQVVIYATDYFPELAVGGGRGLQAIYSAYVKNGKVYFCVGRSEDEPKGHIAVYNQALLPLKTIYFSGFPGAENFLPREMAIGNNGLIYVVGVNASAVKVLDQDGKYLREILPRDEVMGVLEKALIYSLHIGLDGRLYFLSEERGRVYVYDQEEAFLFKFGEKGGGEGKLARPRGISVDEKRGKVYIVDYLRHTASAYSTSGKYLFEFGGLGASRGWFNFPTDVTVDSHGHVLITDTFNNRVQVFKVVD